MRKTITCAVLAAAIVLGSAPLRADETTATEAAAPPQTELLPCIELPTGEVTDEQLKALVPDDSPGRVFIRWRTESQEDNYGFNIYRGLSKDGPYEKINPAIIPGEGTTNIPKDYCYMDTGLERGKKQYYYIESVSNSGVSEVVEGTMGTEVTVKTVDAEREWVRRKAQGGDAQTTTPVIKPADDATTSPAPAAPTN